MTMSVPCPRCNKALKVEDVHVKTYVPVNDLQTCGKISVAKNGRVVAKVIRAGEGIECDGTLEGAIEADMRITLSERPTWKGKSLMTRALVVEDGAKLLGHVKVPWERPAPPPSISPLGAARSILAAKGPIAPTNAGGGAGAPASAAELKPLPDAPPTDGADQEQSPPASAQEPAMP